MAEFATIYVNLMDEAVDVWRPVNAEKLGQDTFRIPSSQIVPEIEKWQFGPGTTVRCKKKELSGGSVGLVAFEKIE